MAGGQSTKLGSAYGVLELRNEMDKGVASAEKELDKAEKTITGKLDGIGKRATKAGGLMTAGVTLPIIGMGVAAVNTARNFDEIFAGTAAIAKASGSTAEDIDKMKAAIVDFGKKGVFSTTEVALAVDDMVKDGLDPALISLYQLPAVYDLAAASGENLATSQVALSDTMQAFGAETKEAQKYADTFANFLNATPGSIYDFSEALKPVGPIAASNGIDIDELSGALAVLANNGIRGSDAGNSLKRILLNLQSPTKEMQDSMDQLGISVYDSEGNMRSLTDILIDFEEGLKGATQEEKNFHLNAIGGAYGVTALNTLINSGTGELIAFTEQMNESGTASKIAADRQEGLSASLKKSGAAMESAMQPLGEVIGELIVDLSERLIPILEKIVEWFTGLSPTTQKIIVVVIALVAALGPLLLIFGAIATAVTALGPVFAVIGTVISAIGAPILIIIGILIALGVIIYANRERIREFIETAKQKFTEFKDNIPVIWENIKESFRNGVDAVINFIKELPAKAGEFLQQMLENFAFVIGFLIVYVPHKVGEFVGKAIVFLKQLPDKAKEFFTQLWNNIVNRLTEIGNWIVINVPIFLDKFVNFFRELPGRIWTFLTELPTKMREGLDKMGEVVTEFLTSAYDWGKNLIKEFIKGIKSSIGGIKDAFTEGMNAAKASLKGQSPPKEGPFKDIDDWGVNIGESWAEGINFGINKVKLPEGGTAFSASGVKTRLNSEPVRPPMTFNINVDAGMYVGTPQQTRDIAKTIFKAFRDVASAQGVKLDFIDSIQ